MLRPALFCVGCFLMCGGVSADEKAEFAKLAKDMKSKDAKVRLKAIEDAAQRGEGAKSLAKELCDAMLDANGKCSTAALIALEGVRPDLYKPLAKIALDANKQVKITGIRELAALGEEAQPAIRILHNGLRNNLDRHTHPDYGEIPGAIYPALKAIKADDKETLTLLRTIATPGGVATILGGVGKKANSQANEHRFAALEFLMSWAGDDEDRRKTMIPLIKAGFDNGVTILGCLNLAGQYGKLSKELLPTLKQLKLSDTQAVREAATKAVESIEADIIKK